MKAGSNFPISKNQRNFGYPKFIYGYPKISSITDIRNSFTDIRKSFTDIRNSFTDIQNSFTDIRNYLRISINEFRISVNEFQISVISDYLHGMLAITILFVSFPTHYSLSFLLEQIWHEILVSCSLSLSAADGLGYASLQAINIFLNDPSAAFQL